MLQLARYAARNARALMTVDVRGFFSGVKLSGMSPSTGTTAVDFTSATEPTKDVLRQIDSVFGYPAWNNEQQARADRVRKAIIGLCTEIVSSVPPSEDRTVAFRM